MTVRAAFFDWGHTLFDTPGSVDFIVDWSARHGTPIAAEQAAVLWEHARRRSRTPEEMAKGRDLSAAVHHECWTALWAPLDELAPGIADALHVFETSAAGWAPFVDTGEVLEELRRRGIPVVVVSDVPFDLRPIFAHYGLGHLVHTYVLSGEHGTVKPELRLFRIAMEAVGVRPDEAVMVGDNHANDGAAVEVGIRTLLLPQVAHGEPRGLWAAVDLIDS